MIYKYMCKLQLEKKKKKKKLKGGVQEGFSGKNINEYI